MTVADLTALLESDLSDRINRLVLSDALEDAGRTLEASLCRNDEIDVTVKDGEVSECLTLGKFLKFNECVVAWVMSIGTPNGEIVPLGIESGYAEQVGILNLTGTVDEDCRWQWDGEGERQNVDGSDIRDLCAWPSRQRWEELVADYNNEGW